jgi:DNA-binding transcriptional LysR family regulator
LVLRDHLLDMDLWQLHIFCKVVELKSFSKAGKTVHLSQPTVSSHIKDLEDHFGCRLVDRLSRESVPTKAGSILYDYARKLIALKDETETALAEFQGKIKGRLTIGGSTIPGTYILPWIIGAFISNYPEVKLSLVIGDTRKIIEEIVSGIIEFGVVGAKTADKSIIQEKLIDDELCLIVSKDHRWSSKKRIKLSTLFKEPFVVRKQGSGTLSSIRRSLEKKGCRLDDFNIVAEMGSTEAVCQGIKGKVGVSILSPRAVSEELKAGTLKAIILEDLDLRQSFYLTRHRYRSLTPLGRTFISFLQKRIK